MINSSSPASTVKTIHHDLHPELKNGNNINHGQWFL